MIRKILIAGFFTAMMLVITFSSAAEQAIIVSHEEENLERIASELEIYNRYTNGASAELPEWSIGDFWEYDLSMAVIIDLIIDIEIEIKVLRMEMKVTEISSDEYTLSIFGHLESLTVSGFDYFQYVPSKSVSGIAYIDKETLAMKNFSLSLEGNGKDLVPPFNIDISFDIEFYMEFDPYLDFLDFPLAVGDAWNLESVIDFSINGTVVTNGENTPIEYNFSNITINEELAIVAEEEISVPAGDFNAFKISGQNFTTWYNSSEIGYVAKLSGNFPLGVAKSNFYCSLDGLTSTNFNYPDNNVPSIPSFNGPTQVTAGEEYDYTLKTSDPNGDPVYYIVDWGDDTINDWFGPYASDEEVVKSHTFEKQAEYKCRVKAKDENGYQTCWTVPIIVTAPFNIPDSSQSQQGSQQQNSQQQSSQQQSSQQQSTSNNLAFGTYSL